MALWNIDDQEFGSHHFGDTIIPVDVLDEFDVLLTFTFRDVNGQLVLAHNCAVGPGVSRYVACQTNNTTVSDLKSGMTSIRSALLKRPLWIIDVAADGRVQRTWRFDSEKDLPRIIPDEGVLLNTELEDAIRSDTRLARFAKSGSAGHVVFAGAPVDGNHTIDAGFYGRFWQAADRLYGAICDHLNAKHEPLRLGMTEESSYAVDIKIASHSQPEQMFEVNGEDGDKAREAFDHLMSMIADEEQPQSSTLLVKKYYQIRQRLGSVLELVSRESASIAVRTRTNPTIRRLSSKLVQARLAAIKEFGYPYRQLSITGELIGGFVERLKKGVPGFWIRVRPVNEEETDFRGSVDSDAVLKMDGIGFRETVTACLRIEASGDGQTYTLIDIERAADDAEHVIR